MQEVSLLIGTYTTGTDSRGVYRVKMRGGVALAPQLALETRDPSYLLRADDALYWVDEALNETEGRIGCAHLQGDTYAATQIESTQGTHPCHLALSPQGGFMAAANYTSGDVAVYRADETGAWQAAGLFQGRHVGPNPQRQEGPHAHFVTFRRETELLCCDLGGDCLRRLTCVNGVWQEQEPLLFFPAGSGPRHMVIRGEIAYVLCELSSELMTVDLKRGEILSKQYILREYKEGTAAALKLSPTGELLASHRGADTISVFSLETPHAPALKEVAACGGSSPRDFLPLEDGSIVCACQRENALSILKKKDGRYKAVQWIALPAPVCVIAE